MDNKTNNKILYISIVILSVIALALGGYIVYDKTQDKKTDNNTTTDNTKTNTEVTNTNTETPVENTEIINDNTNTVETKDEEPLPIPEIDTTLSKLDDTKDWVYDAEYEKAVDADSYSNRFGNTYTPEDIVVPYINIDSQYATEANNEIKSVFDEAINIYNKGVNDSEGIPHVEECGYKVYYNDGILSIIFTFGYGYTDVVNPSYYVYNIDMKTGNQATYEETYNIAGFTSNDIDSKVENAITNAMNEIKKEYPNDNNFDTYINQSINNYKESVSNNTIRYYLTNNKKLEIVVSLIIPSGTGKFDTLITVE